MNLNVDDLAQVKKEIPSAGKRTKKKEKPSDAEYTFVTTMNAYQQKNTGTASKEKQSTEGRIGGHVQTDALKARPDAKREKHAGQAEGSQKVAVQTHAVSKHADGKNHVTFLGSEIQNGKSVREELNAVGRQVRLQTNDERPLTRKQENRLQSHDQAQHFPLSAKALSASDKVSQSLQPGNRKQLPVMNSHGDTLDGPMNAKKQVADRNSQVKDSAGLSTLFQKSERLHKANQMSITDAKEESSSETAQIQEKAVQSKSTGKQNQRVFLGQMNKLELWASFQSGEGAESQSKVPVHEQIAEHLKSFGKASLTIGKNGVQSYTVTLYPEHLGKLIISVSRDEHGLSARLTAETEKARDLIKNGLEQLKQDCASRGVSLTQIDVNRQLYQQTAQSELNQQGQGGFQQDNPQEDRQRKEQHEADKQENDNNHSFFEWMAGEVI